MGRREEEAMAAIRDKKEELYSMIAEARRYNHRIGWRNRALLWCLSAMKKNVVHRRPHDLERYIPYTGDSTFSKIMGFTITSTILLLLGRNPKESKEASGEVAVKTT
jgi:hypothetical protein